ncbi:GspH/FimT family pseudopilin [Ferribacterium limneticum]|uniref:GspH/FimT family pseudopilin n=1 Tax=Ferribacterium limneticum TaxID=76259 RepID=UPI001CF94472|nr:GspH/FimT family pseudopilin [Ferribacterium limneticum]UCV27514.1 prepilin-type N-terminal cleavage/methylation domain-containing protein [Ferribacterium limneticum]UCV31431.1 prepilin-type N-terminal cleavage/methylation domain-containing protein [Ferribacterium limneticum]
MTPFDGRPGLKAGPFVFNAEPTNRTSSAGFSLVELVVVIVLLGIIAAVAIPRWQGGSGFEERGLRDQVVAALRYAQKSAVAARRTVCVSFSTSPSKVDFSISSTYGAADCSTGTSLTGPDGTNLSVVASGASTITSSASNFTFDAAGRPSAAASISVSGLPAALAITVENETGYVH